MYDAYYSRTALELMMWAREENNRLKASRIAKVAQSVEERYRKAHWEEVADPYRKPSPLLLAPPKPPFPLEPRIIKG